MNIKKENQMARIVCGLEEFANTRGTIVIAKTQWWTPYGTPGWKLDRTLWNATRTKSFDCIGDCCLRPIDDKPGEDEMLRIAGKPQPLEKPAETPVKIVRHKEHV